MAAREEPSLVGSPQLERARAEPKLSRQSSLTEADDDVRVPNVDQSAALDVENRAVSIASIITENQGTTGIEAIVDGISLDGSEGACDGGPPTISAAVLGKSKGGVKSSDTKKPWGYIFPAVRKYVALDRNDDDSVVRVSLVELFIFVIMLISMMVYTFGRRAESEYYFTKVHRTLFTQTDSNGDSTTYEGMVTTSDFWTYMENEFVNGLYWEEWYNGDAPFPYEGYVFGESKVLGRAQMRQLRVEEGSCKIHDQFADLINECYDQYTTAEEGKTTFKQANTSYYTWNSEDVTGYGSHYGEITKYAGSGYLALLGSNKAETLNIIADLKDNLWLERSTRAVMIDFNLYNANINLFLIVRLAVEFPATGGLVVSSKFRNVRLLRYHTTKDYIFAGFEMVYAALVLYYLVEMVFTGLYLGWRRMLIRFWTWYDLINLGLGISYLAFSLKSYLDVESLLEELLGDVSGYVNFEDLAYSAEVFREMNGINVFLSWIKLFKFLNFTKTMAELQATLAQSASDLLGFLFMFAIVFTAYAQCGYLVFGALLRDFSTFPDSLFTLFRIILGDFDFFALEKSNPILGPIYFISFVLVVFFVLLNMFLAIVADTYSSVKNDAIVGSRGKIFGTYLKKVGSNLKTKLKKLKKLEHKLTNADKNHDNYIDVKELEDAVGKDIAERLMKKFDLSHDHKISIEEKDRMMQALQEETMKTAELLEKTEKQQNVQYGTLADQEEFDRLSNRVHRLERSLGTIASRITTMINKMEKIERARARIGVQQLVKKRDTEEAENEKEPQLTSFEI